MEKERLTISGSDIYEYPERIFLTDDLITCGREITNFAQEALISDDRAALIGNYYKTLIGMRKADAECSAPFNIFTGNDAVKRYLALNSPARYADIKCLEILKDFGKTLCCEFRQPTGGTIKKEQIEEILAYLEDEFCFLGKVFDRWTPHFSFLQQCHIRERTHWRKVTNLTGETIYFFLYPDLESEDAAIETIFRLLASVMFYRCIYEAGALATMVRERLEEWYYPDITLLPQKERLQVIANGLSLGLMKDSPFEPKAEVSLSVQEGRKALQDLVRQIFKKL